MLRSQLQTGKYAAIKQLLLRRYSLSTAERADKLLSLPGLGNGLVGDVTDTLASDGSRSPGKLSVFGCW